MAGASAQTLYKQVDGAGHLTFADQAATTPSPRTATVPALDVASALASNSAVSSRRAVMIDAKEAARRLRQAQLQREQGAAPLPGELTQSTGAGVANHRYWRRQEKLRYVVEQALRRSNETRQTQLALR